MADVVRHWHEHGHIIDHRDHHDIQQHRYIVHHEHRQASQERGAGKAKARSRHDESPTAEAGTAMVCAA